MYLRQHHGNSNQGVLGGVSHSLGNVYYPEKKRTSIEAKQKTPAALSEGAKRLSEEPVAKRFIRKLTRKREAGLDNSLVLSDHAYFKLKHFRDSKTTEVGCMGITRPDDPLHVEDLAFIRQECTSVSTDFDEQSQTNWTIDMMESGQNPENFMRIWIHTHPCTSCSPSSTDWETFEEIFAQTKWGVMAILGTSNQMSCVFRVKDSLINIPVEIAPRPAPDQWEEELKLIGKPRVVQGRDYYAGGYRLHGQDDYADYVSWDQYEKITGLISNLTGESSYSLAKNWNPSLGDILGFGVCKAIKIVVDIIDAAAKGDDTDKKIAEDMAKKVADALGVYGSLITQYDPEKYIDLSPMVALQVSREGQFKRLDKFMDKYPDAMTAFLWQNDKDPDICISLASLDKIFDQIVSENEEVVFAAILDCVASVYGQFNDAQKYIDETIANSLESSLASLQEEEQCHKELKDQKLSNGTNDTSDTAKS